MDMMANGIRTSARAVLLAASMMGGAAIAQTAAPAARPVIDNDVLPDIVVTAQRRSESVQDVPIAVSAFSADLLSQRGIATPLQLIQYVPNLFGSNNTGLGSANAYYIRGLGNTETIASFDPPVGTYIDDIYMSRQNGNNFAFFDLDRIEVLRGPQGTLFGRNTTGGAVQLKLTDTLTWNLSGTYMRNDGENLINFECDPANTSNCSGRFATTGLRTKLANGATSPFAALGVKGRKANYGLGNEVDTQIYVSNLEWTSGDFTVNAITGFINMRQQFALDFADGRGLPNVANPFPAVRGFPSGGFSILNDGSHTQFTQEFKLNGKLFDGRVEFVTGFFYINEDNTTDFADVFNLGFPGPNGFPFLLADRTLVNGANAKAGYFQADFNVTDALKLTAGIRYTDEEKTFTIFDNRDACSGATPPGNCLVNSNLAVNLPTGRVAIPTTQRAKVWTPRFVANYRINDDALIYASATRGFKSGGWNARGTAPNLLLPFDPEKVWSYEAGAKTDFLDNRLRVNLTGFWLETKALQTPSAFVDPVNGAVTFITQNFADYQNKGVELEISAVPVRGLNLYANMGYQNDKYKVSDTLLPNQYGVKAVRQQQNDCRAQLATGRVPLGPTGPNNAPDCAAGIVDANGNIAGPVRTPEFSIAFGGSYDFPIPNAGIILTPSVNALYRSSLETGTAAGTIFSGPITAPSGAVFPTNPFDGTVIAGSLTNAFWQVSAAITMRTDDNNWTVSLECENCFDKAFFQSSLVNYNYLNPPRTWQIRAKRVF